MASYAIIENGMVVNAAEAEADYAAEQGWFCLLTALASAGHILTVSSLMSAPPLSPRPLQRHPPRKNSKRGLAPRLRR